MMTHWKISLPFLPKDGDKLFHLVAWLEFLLQVKRGGMSLAIIVRKGVILLYCLLHMLGLIIPEELDMFTEMGRKIALMLAKLLLEPIKLLKQIQKMQVSQATATLTIK